MNSYHQSQNYHVTIYKKNPGIIFSSRARGVQDFDKKNRWMIPLNPVYSICFILLPHAITSTKPRLTTSTSHARHITAHPASITPAISQASHLDKASTIHIITIKPQLASISPRELAITFNNSRSSPPHLRYITPEILTKFHTLTLPGNNI